LITCPPDSLAEHERECYEKLLQAPVGLGFVGIKVAGADCVANGILWP
jgi:hypothetical protein